MKNMKKIVSCLAVLLGLLCFANRQGWINITFPSKTDSDVVSKKISELEEYKSKLTAQYEQTLKTESEAVAQISEWESKIEVGNQYCARLRDVYKQGKFPQRVDDRLFTSKEDLKLTLEDVLIQIKDQTNALTELKKVKNSNDAARNQLRNEINVVSTKIIELKTHINEQNAAESLEGAETILNDKTETSVEVYMSDLDSIIKRMEISEEKERQEVKRQERQAEADKLYENFMRDRVNK